MYQYTALKQSIKSPYFSYSKQQRFTLLVPEVPVTSPRVSGKNRCTCTHTPVGPCFGGNDSGPAALQRVLKQCIAFRAVIRISLSLRKINKKITIIGRNGVDFS